MIMMFMNQNDHDDYTEPDNEIMMIMNQMLMMMMIINQMMVMMIMNQMLILMMIHNFQV